MLYISGIFNYLFRFVSGILAIVLRRNGEYVQSANDAPNSEDNFRQSHVFSSLDVPMHDPRHFSVKLLSYNEEKYGVEEVYHFGKLDL